MKKKIAYSDSNSDGEDFLSCTDESGNDRAGSLYQVSEDNDEFMAARIRAIKAKQKN